MDTLTRDTAKSYLWNQIAVTFDGVTIILASILVGRLLGDETLGLYGWVMSAVGMFALAAGLGFKEGISVLVQHVEGDRAALGALFRAAMRVRILSALLAAAIAAVFFALLGGLDLATGAAASAYVVLVLVSGLLSSFNVALFQTRTVAVGKLVSSIITLCVVVIGGLMQSIAVVFGGLALGTLAGVIIFFAPLSNLLSGSERPRPLKDLFGLSLSLWLIGFFNYILASQSVPFVLKLSGASRAQIGVFTAGLLLATAATRAFMGGFANVSLAAFSRAARNGGDSLARMYSLYVRVTAIFGVPILLGAVVFSPFLAKIPVKNASPAVALILSILAGAFLAIRVFGGGAHQNVLYAAGLHRVCLVLRASFAAVSFAGVYYACSYFGPAAAAAAAGFFGLSVIIAEYVYIRRKLGFEMPWCPLIRLTVACGAAALAATVIETQGGVFALVFAAIVFAVGSFCAVVVAHPLEKGEVAQIGVSGRLARAMLLFEVPDDHDA